MELREISIYEARLNDLPAKSTEVPDLLSFVSANEKLEKVMDVLFENPRTSEVVIADAEFDLGKYVEQIKLVDALRR